MDISYINLCPYLFVLLSGTGIFTEPEDYNLDGFSDVVILSNVYYHRYYVADTFFPYRFDPGVTTKEGKKIASIDDLENAFHEGMLIEQDKFTPYYSNLMIHRYLYRFLGVILPVSGITLIHIFRFINALFTAICIVVFLFWFSTLLSQSSAVVTLALLLLAPSVASMATNLYWSIWGLFIPLLGALFITKRIKATEKNYYILSMAVAFVTCLLKQLMYFELVTTAMIMLMLPFIAHCIVEMKSIKNSLRCLWPPVVGAILSFIGAIGLKFLIALSRFGNMKEALAIVMHPINKRIIGNSSDIKIMWAAAAPYRDVIITMLKQTALSIENLLFISQFMVLIVFGLSVILLYILNRKFGLVNWGKNSIIISLFSNLAPLSWFILAKPHTIIHSPILQFLWFVPGTLTSLTVISYAFTCLYRMVSGTAERSVAGKKAIRFNFRYIAPVALVVVLLLFADYAIVNKPYRDFVEQNGRLLYTDAIEEEFIYEYHNRYYFIRPKESQRTEIVMRFIPQNQSELQESDKKQGYEIIRVSLEEFELDYPFWNSYLMARINAETVYIVEEIEVED